MAKFGCLYAVCLTDRIDTPTLTDMQVC